MKKIIPFKDLCQFGSRINQTATPAPNTAATIKTTTRIWGDDDVGVNGSSASTSIAWVETKTIGEATTELDVTGMVV